MDGISMPNEVPVRLSSPTGGSFNSKSGLHEVFSPLHCRKRHGSLHGTESVMISSGCLKNLVSDMEMNRDHHSMDTCETSNEGSCAEGEADQLACGFRVNSKWVMAYLSKESLSWAMPGKKLKTVDRDVSECIPINEIIAVEHIRPEEPRYQLLCREKV